MIKSLLLRLLATAGLLWLLTQMFPTGFQVTNGLTGFVMIWLVLGILNAVVRPLLAIVTLPVAILSGFLASLIVNLLILVLCAKVLQGLETQTQLIMVGWTPTLVAAAAMGLLHWLLKK